MNEVKLVKGITKVYFAGALAGSFAHIVTAAYKLGADNPIEAIATPFMIDGIAIIGMVMRGEKFSARTNKIGFRVQAGAGALSLAMNVIAAHSLFGVLFGVAIVALFVFAEWLKDQIQGREVDSREEEERAAEAARQAAQAIVDAEAARVQAEADALAAKKAATVAKRNATRKKNLRIKRQQEAALESLMA